MDIFLALVQKIGVWEFNIDIKWPKAFLAMTSWLKFPAIGWELALELPDIQDRGWLYWVILVGGILLPVVLAIIIRYDTGNIRVGDPFAAFAWGAMPARAKEGRSGVEEDRYQDQGFAAKYKARAILRAALVSAAVGALGVFFVATGASGDDGQLLGFGCVLLLLGAGYFLWERFKLAVMENALSQHDQQALPAYRAMRVFVCSTVFVTLLRSIYIMTISALCLTIMEAAGKPKRTGELVFAALLIGPVAASPPIGLWFAAKNFEDKYITEGLQEASDGDAFRGWLERFSQREVDAPMWESAVASLVVSFEADKWYFAVVQLSERALATIIATCLADHTSTQLGLAIAIEASNTVVELLLHPFADSEEDFYNLTWRLMAVGILVTALLIELVGEAFYVAGDAILVLLMTAALCVFLYALDPASIYRAYQRYTATKKCRKALHPARGEQQHQGGGGIDANMMKAALGDIPQGFWNKATIVQDALSIVEMYKIAAKCDEDEDMNKLVVVHGLLYSAGPLMSLAGASNASLELGGNIPRSIGVFCSVTRLILADMKLEDGCGVEHLAAMARLKELNLDGNLFTRCRRVSGN